MYAGIEKLVKEGDWLQWGGPRLFTDGFAKMPGGRARFVTVPIPEIHVPEDKFYFSTRRGKQFNSMTYGPRDPLTGSRRRDDVFLSPADAGRLGLKQGDPVVVRSALGEFRGHVRLADIRQGNVQAYWPEGNVLIERRYDPVSQAPDYNVVVEISRDGAQ
jgi:anaerobic selenocysteine-containing dehydrogenase